MYLEITGVSYKIYLINSTTKQNVNVQCSQAWGKFLIDRYWKTGNFNLRVNTEPDDRIHLLVESKAMYIKNYNSDGYRFIKNCPDINERYGCICGILWRSNRRLYHVFTNFWRQMGPMPAVGGKRMKRAAPRKRANK